MAIIHFLHTITLFAFVQLVPLWTKFFQLCTSDKFQNFIITKISATYYNVINSVITSVDQDPNKKPKTK